MKLWMTYLKQRRRGILAGILFCGIFTVSFALYELPVKAVGYPALLCAALGILFVILDVQRAKKKHRLLAEIQEINDLLTEHLPVVDGMEDEDYQAILQKFQEEHREVLSDKQREYAEMVDYYTIWAHQIKTPIASMRLTLQNEDTALSRQLTNELFRIEQYVEMVLMFLRLDSNSTDYVIKEYELDAMIKSAVRKFAGQFIRRRIRLDYQPVDEKVLTDEKWFSFVIEQVLSNALKYTSEGAVTITVEDTKTLCIRDTGMGIAPEDLPRIFEKGYTGYNGRSDKIASGIGLYLCKRICNNLGHRITAESEPNKGTVIKINMEQVNIEIE